MIANLNASALWLGFKMLGKTYVFIVNKKMSVMYTLHQKGNLK